MRKAIFLDRDGTINVEKHYLYKIEDFEFIPGALEGLEMLQDAGYLLIVITNQSGIGRGFYTEKDLKLLNDWMICTLKGKGINLTAVYYCPHLPDAPLAKYRKECDCRKPKLGLFEQAISDYGIDLNESYAIGDKIRDLGICAQTSCRGFLVGRNEKPEIIEKVRNGQYRHVQHANNIYDCALAILEK